MAGLVQIRNVPDETRRTLKARAASRGVSLNDLLLELLVEEAARPTVAEVLARSRTNSEMSTVSAVDVVRGERDARS
jgi:plasmid stability protein